MRWLGSILGVLLGAFVLFDMFERLGLELARGGEGNPLSVAGVKLLVGAVVDAILGSSP